MTQITGSTKKDEASHGMDLMADPNNNGTLQLEDYRKKASGQRSILNTLLKFFTYII